MRKKTFFLLLSLYWVYGCATSAQDSPAIGKRILSKNYLRDIQKYDGINLEEAILLAKNEILFRGYERTFDINKPEVFLQDRQLWGIRFLPVTKTMGDILSGRMIDIFVHKNDGRIHVRKNF